MLPNSIAFRAGKGVRKKVLAVLGGVGVDRRGRRPRPPTRAAHHGWAAREKKCHFSGLKIAILKYILLQKPTCRRRKLTCYNLIASQSVCHRPSPTPAPLSSSHVHNSIAETSHSHISVRAASGMQIDSGIRRSLRQACCSVPPGLTLHRIHCKHSHKRMQACAERRAALRMREVQRCMLH